MLQDSELFLDRHFLVANIQNFAFYFLFLFIALLYFVQEYIYVKFCILLHTLVLYKTLLLKVNIREITLLKNLKADSSLKRFCPDCTYANTDYFIAWF